MVQKNLHVASIHVSNLVCNVFPEVLRQRAQLILGQVKHLSGERRPDLHLRGAGVRGRGGWRDGEERNRLGGHQHVADGDEVAVAAEGGVARVQPRRAARGVSDHVVVQAGVLVQCYCLAIRHRHAPSLLGGLIATGPQVVSQNLFHVWVHWGPHHHLHIKPHVLKENLERFVCGRQQPPRPGALEGLARQQRLHASLLHHRLHERVVVAFPEPVL
mmetsp:Transcript_13772/g.26421  ORF Transcript_13772/g.26421 Transcript_13772/m.26421 type:complete len:216 (+) Transcript_13772:161-808(+)